MESHDHIPPIHAKRSAHQSYLFEIPVKKNSPLTYCVRIIRARCSAVFTCIPGSDIGTLYLYVALPIKHGCLNCDFFLCKRLQVIYSTHTCTFYSRSVQLAPA